MFDAHYIEGMEEGVRGLEVIGIEMVPWAVEGEVDRRCASIDLCYLGICLSGVGMKSCLVVRQNYLSKHQLSQLDQ